MEKLQIRASLQDFDVTKQVEVEKYDGKISAPFRQKITLCKTGHSFFNASNYTTSNDGDFFVAPGGDAIKASNTPDFTQARNPRSLNPYKKINHLSSSANGSLPRTGVDSPRDWIREEDGTASTAPK
jgi:hypothetical protein